MDKRKIVRMLLEAEDSAMKAYNEFSSRKNFGIFSKSEKIDCKITLTILLIVFLIFSLNFSQIFLAVNCIDFPLNNLIKKITWIKIW